MDFSGIEKRLSQMAIRAIQFHMGEVELILDPPPGGQQLDGVFRQVVQISFRSATWNVEYRGHDPVESGRIAVAYGANINGDFDGSFYRPEVTVTYKVGGQPRTHTFSIS